MRIVVVGAGYVGLVSAACIADFGHSVTCVDTDVTKIDALRAGAIPIYEPGLADLVRGKHSRGKIIVHNDACRAGPGC